MKEVEIAKELLKRLSKEDLQKTIKKAATKGFEVDGFSREIGKAPLSVIMSSLERKKRRGPYQYQIFLSSLASMDLEIKEVEYARRWLDEKEDKEALGKEIMKQPEPKVEMKDEKEKADETVKEKSSKEKDSEKKEKINKLQNKINELRLKLEETEKERDKFEKEKKRAEREKENKEEELENVKKEVEIKEEEIDALRKELKMKEEENRKYKAMLDRLPKVILFSKKEVDLSLFSYYYVIQYKNWEDEIEELEELNKYRKLWIIESDYSYSEIQKLKKFGSEKKMEVIIKQNLTKLMDKLGVVGYGKQR